MIINAIDGEERIDLLVQKVSEMILSGISTQKILVLTLNSFEKEKIISKINEKLFSKGAFGYSQLKIMTFAGIVYNSILKNWVNIEKYISKYGGETEVMPTLSGLDVSQYFFRKIIKEEDFSDYFSKKNLMHQLLRRYKLIVENALTDDEIKQKSEILDETFAQSALLAINNYKISSSENRIFDNLKQISSFSFLLKKGLIKDFDDIEYFVADDVDEYNFVAFEFCKYMIKKAKESYIYLDKDGCTREGYLCAYPYVYKELIEEFKQEEKNIDIKSKLFFDAINLSKNLSENQNLNLENFELKTLSKRLEMIETASNKVFELIKKGVKPSQINIVSPIIDENLIYSLNSFFREKNLKIQFLTGNKKIIEDIYVYALITLLELLNPQWNIFPSVFDIRILLNEILQIPIYECEKFITHFVKTNKLPSEVDTNNLGYEKLISLLDDESLKESEISTQFEVLFAQIIAPNMRQEVDFEPINLFFKSITEFEKIKDNFAKFNNIELTPRDWLLHIKNSVVSQNPSAPAHISSDAVVVSTAQKIIDFSISADFQIWLDVSSSEWIKEDTGTIYNSWVFQKNFKEKEFTPQMNKQFTLQKTARILRKLVLLAKEKIFAYSSVFDVSGRENYGELINFIHLEEERVEKFNFIPREDQKGILSYNGGRLAVPAVPGAGKTTVMLALLFELMKKGENPQEILVLTYMESAARNFLNRFKKNTQNRTKLPQISTIHAFAYKLLMENNNYALVNLPENFSICDDALKIAMIKDLCAQNLPLGENLEDWASLMILAISKVKLNQISAEKIKNEAKKDSHIREFWEVFDLYTNKLKDTALLDYDDLLIYSIKLLKENPQIAFYYQNKFKYIIEDEAQDSSGIQQELINILSKKYNNVIRCGDVNQAILGTFSNSDVQGFKEFISKNDKVEMYCSQRCCEDVYSLANELVDFAKSSPVMQDAFYDLKMKGVDGKNPISQNAVHCNVLENMEKEREFVISDIKNKLANSPNVPTFAILLRRNKQVALWANYLEKQGLKVLCRGDDYRQKKVFCFVLAAMELFVNSWNNKVVASFYKECCNIELFKFDKTLFEYIANNTEKFLQPDFLQKYNINNEQLVKFWWEAFSIAESHTLDIQEIVINCANRYFTDVIDRSNVYLFSVLIKRYVNTISTDEKFKLNYIFDVIKYFKNLLSQKTLKGINFFAKEDEAEDMSGFVQIMTVHKAKGAEFDYVYLPEFTDFNYSMNFSIVAKRIQSRKKPLLTKLEKIHSGQDVSVAQSAKEEINETLRLIYVAITRAKLGLSFSYSLKNEFKKDNAPVDIPLLNFFPID